MSIKQIPLPGEIVKKDNEIVRSYTNISNKTSGKLLACLISQLNESDTDFKDEYKLEIMNYMEHLQAYGGTQISQIREACKALAEAKVWIDTFDYDKKSKKDRFAIIPYFSRLKYENGILTVKFNSEMKKFLLQIKSFYTQYNLLEYLSLPSIYSQKLFELLKSWEKGNDIGYVEFSLKDLHEFLGTPDSFRSDFGNFKKRILLKAEKDINKTSLEFSWEAIKTGHAVTSVRFTFRDKIRKRIEYKKKEDEEEKRRKKVNDDYAQAVTCAKQKNGECLEDTQKKAVCEICRKVGMVAEIRKTSRESSDAVSVGSLLSFLPERPKT